jgi:hypothetical protein
MTHFVHELNFNLDADEWYLGFDWASLPRGSTIVDVGGGIGSSSMMIADKFCWQTSCEGIRAADKRFKFVIQDRPVVVEMGIKVNCFK